MGSDLCSRLVYTHVAIQHYKHLTHCSSVIVINKLTIIMADTVETTTPTPAEETTPAVETAKPEADVAVKETESTNGTSTENGKAEEVKETSGTSEAATEEKNEEAKVTTEAKET